MTENPPKRCANGVFRQALGNCVVIVKNVPSQVCVQCGEVTYDSAVAKQLENISGGVRTANTEIAVVNYYSPAA